MRKHLFLSVMLGLCAFSGMTVYPTPAMATVTQSPTIKVRGQIVDEQGEPMPGATVRVKGGQGGTITDLDGNFQLEVPGNAILLISYVGFKEREVAVRNRAIIDTIQLQADDQMLEQVVVVGYGTQKKSDLTGSVAVVDAEALKQTSNSNISTMLEGKVSGVQVTSDGQPGADPTVRIRGVGSFGSTSPLYVIDGVPMGTSIRDFSSNVIKRSLP
jgi:TonB-dependent starch-binding outer membrane protein SusC